MVFLIVWLHVSKDHLARNDVNPVHVSVPPDIYFVDFKVLICILG